MFKVWILIFYVDGYHAGGPAVVDNIASLSECRRVASEIRGLGGSVEPRCIEVWKVSDGR